MTAMSYGVEIKSAAGQFAKNGIRFATKPEAEQYAARWEKRSAAVIATVVERHDPANSYWDFDKNDARLLPS